MTYGSYATIVMLSAVVKAEIIIMGKLFKEYSGTIWMQFIMKKPPGLSVAKKAF